MNNRRQKIKQQLKAGNLLGKPRLIVYRSLTNLFAQIVEPTGQVAVEASSLKLKGSRTAKAGEVGRAIARQAKEKKIKSVVFDRNGFSYKGSVKVLAESAREEGLII